ncbi:hypothetical protein K431DRAFT_61675 [Polychaeton citri CBS 116435]|uniref:Secreted protein n=1 Tax=Polychaeton citri CBS 116435 TaxID=1314669 RepID=A0A9P4Q9I3_9PEZI|nr:hypothetical protein K431DRAFT_61675 [Polychaeton citri CBS 116435]
MRGLRSSGLCLSACLSVCLSVCLCVSLSLSNAGASSRGRARSHKPECLGAVSASPSRYPSTLFQEPAGWSDASTVEHTRTYKVMLSEKEMARAYKAVSGGGPVRTLIRTHVPRPWH